MSKQLQMEVKVENKNKLLSTIKENTIVGLVILFAVVATLIILIKYTLF